MSETPRITREAVRLVEVNRAQARLVSVDLEALLPPDHQARAIWALVERVDLSGFYAHVAAREGTAGRPATDPQVLLALWIQATVDGIGSARAIERQCAQNLPYQWICGGKPVGYHTLSDFRSESSDQLQEVLTQLVAMLMSQDLVQLQRVAQDGMRVRASAGASSFRKRPTLEKLQKIARRQVETLTRQIDDETAVGTKRETAARLRAEEDREQRIARALDEMNEVEQRKKSNNGKKKSEPRASTTDPSARVMKMGDGGFRPAYNVHLATDAETRVIVAVDVDNRGTDTHEMVPLAKQVEQLFEKRPGAGQH
jgi:transposase